MTRSTVLHGEHQVVQFAVPTLRQTTIDVFFQKNGALSDMDGVVNIGNEAKDQIGDPNSDLDLIHQNSDLDLISAIEARPSEYCFVCPICPDELGSRRDFVVYKTSKTLWQHWNVHLERRRRGGAHAAEGGRKRTRQRLAGCTPAHKQACRSST